MKNFNILLLFGVLVLSGCTMGPTYRVDVTSIGSANENKTYILLPGNKDTSVDDLQFKEYATYVARALHSKGFTPAKTFQEANVAIFVGYGISTPKERQISYSLPTYGKTGISSSHTTGTVSTYGSHSSYSGTTTYMPSYGVTGYQTMAGTRTTYFRFMFLSAVNLAEYTKSKKEVQLWKANATSEGSSGDLRMVFPILVAALKDYIATNTGHKVRVELLETDTRVLEIKGTIKEIQ